MADANGVDIRLYNIIYKLVKTWTRLSRACLSQCMQIKSSGAPRFARPSRSEAWVSLPLHRARWPGQRDAKARVRRGEEVIFEGGLHSLKRFQEDVKEVKTGFDCGVAIEGFGDYKEGDMIEFYVKERVS